MANNHSGRGANRQGAVLLTVITVACFAAVLLTAIISFVNRSHTNAYNNYNSEQAYYIASSALGSIHDYFEADGDYSTLLAMADDNSGTGTTGTIKLGDNDISSLIPGGDCKVAVTWMGDAYIRVSVTGTCNGQYETLNAYYAVTPMNKPVKIKNALYAHSDSTFTMAASGQGAISTAGDISLAGGNGADFRGTLACGGDFFIENKLYWSNDPKQTTNSFVSVSGSIYTKNCGAEFSPVLSKTDDNASQYISVGKSFQNSQSISIGTAECAMDLYCNACYAGTAQNGDYYYNSSYSTNTGSSFVQYGNLYCYKITTDSDGNPISDYTDNGALIIGNLCNTFKVTGDVYAEGNIINRSQNADAVIDGTLYISPTTTITRAHNKSIVCDAISCDGLQLATIANWINDGTVKIVNPAGGYFTFSQLSSLPAEDLVKYVKSDAINPGTTTSRNYKPSTDFVESFSQDYEDSATFLNSTLNSAVKTQYEQAATKNLNSFPQSVNGGDITINVNQSCYIDDSLNFETGGKNYYIYIDVESMTTDCVIRLGHGNSNSVNLDNMIFIVKNGSRKADGTWLREPEHFVYFICENDETDQTPMTVNFGGCVIYDYNTYEKVVKNGYAINSAAVYNDDGTVSNYMNGNYDGTNIYTLNESRVFIMGNAYRDGDGNIVAYDTLNLASANNKNRANLPVCLEAIVYAPGAKVTVGNGGTSEFKYIDTPNSTTPHQFGYLSNQQVRVAVLGAIINENFSASLNTFGVCFVPPAPGSGVGSSDSTETTRVAFSHYESR